MKNIRVSVVLPQELFKLLKSLAEMQEISTTEALRNAICDDHLIRTEARKGSKILIEKRKGKFERMILPGQCS